MSLFEIKRVFQEERQNSRVKESATFSIRNTLEQYGLDQLEANLEHMLRKEAGVGLVGPNFQHNPSDYLKEVHQGRIAPELREEAFLSILQFSVQTECLD